ncbi:la-related protein 7 [Uranotaenia lowii]|uniref:la-related protein 7 n=1 Tax=Uranotaenia lowii TaxID=190385 RepID=UPI002479D8EA|nr:la-related protein 7 [Uranotaenia lowii]
MATTGSNIPSQQQPVIADSTKVSAPSELSTQPQSASKTSAAGGGNSGRHRKKHKFNAIRSQMEFYFSDANLCKDRYLGQKIREDPFVPLEEFLKFNRIKHLTESIEEIATALKNSDQLQVSDDRTKVRRLTEISERANCEECTIYVECLPPKADHDWVRNVFSAYGKVAYVSLPRYRFSKKIKEFGFVEFEEENSVQKALKTFQAFGGVMSYEGTDPDKLLSISSFGKEKDGLTSAEDKSKPEPEKSEKSADKPETELGKRELDLSCEEKKDTNTEEPPLKRLKTSENSDRESEGEGTDVNNEQPEGVEDSDSGQAADNKAEAKGDEDKKKRRRRGISGFKKAIQQDDKLFELKIMPKKDWRRLRNKYLNLQRAEAKKLKKLFAGETKFTKPQPASRSQNPTAGGIPGSKAIKSSPRVNFYGALTDEEAAAEATKLAEEQPEPPVVKQPLFAFEPGLIVHIKFRVPCANVKEFKAELKQFDYVRYVDLKEGDSEAFVRVDKPASANLLVREYCSAEYGAQILSGERETGYWDKISRDRDDKLNKKVKVEKRVRGRTKLMKKINTHIKFDDDDD